MRGENAEERIKEHILQAIGSRAKTGFEEQEKYDGIFENSMTSIGG